MTVPDHLLLTLRLLADSLDAARTRLAAQELALANFAAVVPPECYVVWIVTPGEPPSVVGSCQSRSAVDRMIESYSGDAQIAVQAWDGASWQQLEIAHGEDE